MHVRVFKLLGAVRRLLGGVRVRLTLWYLLVIAVVFLIFSGVVAGTLQHEAEVQEEAILTSAANQLATTYNPSACSITLDDPRQNGTQSAKPGGSTALEKGAGLGYFGVAVLFDTNGRPCTSATDGKAQVYGPLTAAGVADLTQFVFGKASDLRLPVAISNMPLQISTAPSGSPDSASYTASYSVYVMRLGGSSSAGRILVVGSLFDPNQSLQSLVPALLIAGPLTLLVAAVGGYWLASRAMRPVRAITRTARTIGETDLHRRLHLKRRDELGELAATFDGMLDRLEGAFARQRQFTADASHELRTPLTIVELEVTRALAERRPPEEYERVLATIQAENSYMAHLVNDLLTLARADAGHCPLRFERVDLGDLALEVAERLRPLARERGLVLETGALPEVIVRGDSIYLAQMLGNLVENAIKYATGVGTRVAVSVGVTTGEQGRSQAQLRVEDDGPGIAAEHLPHLFERFYRVDAARSQNAEGAAPEGSGLGLSVVEWIAREHGGSVHVLSTPGAGATFDVLLPLAEGNGNAASHGI
jgi:signal transduction histidine kinase